MRFTRVLVPSAAALLFAIQASAQAVISAHSGVVHFSEGSVFIDDQPLDHKIATFPNIKEGSTLRTEKGRAEILLTPGAFLRLDENSAIRMRSNSLLDTKVDFLRGAAIVDTVDAISDNHITVFYKDTEIRFAKEGVYRLDYETGTLQAYSGQAEVQHDGKVSKVDESHLFFFTLDLDTNKLGDGTDDEFYDWARERSNDISAENQLSAQSAGDVGDAGDADNDPNALNVNPNFGFPGSGLPSGSVPNIGISTYPDYRYSVNSALINPIGPYAIGTPYFPYPVFPLVVIVRPYRYRAGLTNWQHNVTGTHPDPAWPHTNPAWSHTNPAWPHTNAAWPRTHPAWPHTVTGTGYRSNWVRTSPMPTIHPSYTAPRYTAPRPMPSAARPTYAPHMGVGAPRPGGAPMHAIGHR